MAQQVSPEHRALVRALDTANEAGRLARVAVKGYADACEKAAQVCRDSNEPGAADAWAGRALAARAGRILHIGYPAPREGCGATDTNTIVPEGK